MYLRYLLKKAPQAFAAGFRGQLLFCFEGFTIGTFHLGRVAFVGSDADGVERTVVLVITVIFALMNGAADAPVCLVTIHFNTSLFEFSFLVCLKVRILIAEILSWVSH